MKLPKRKAIANVPTPIFEVKRSLGETEGLRFFIKRDDFTGLEYTGNKIRKLEYILPDAMEKGAQVLITCGGQQSNHCRATAAIGAQMGLKTHLVLKGKEEKPIGNFFLDKLFGAECTLITEKEYREERAQIMDRIKKKYESQGLTAYVMPEGASSGLGMFGYYHAFQEIQQQEKEMNIQFDTICVATGSGGTYAGLYLGNQELEKKKQLLGINIYDEKKDFQTITKNIITEGLQQTGNEELLTNLAFDQVNMCNAYVGEGYGHCTTEAIHFIKSFARQEGILLDPVYTGKAMHGLFQEIQQRRETLKGNVLFIHTGGQWGVMARTQEFEI
ncbi:1-aminocyclopropane-1-carboxylate deaminase/D-cysteine desulfhydrase [Tindallia californiensis]|uniref:D-cysteine desulfhydrase n=1 Tax=Tindallia californiensis TaxID=159292 RepID=A0A1H3Q2N4_9FIRM|nr:D-cysteine desulfhydrase family protein [Tindallia californiensis]SDZ07764.1 D-cysteine desulfhydrase [Tindallia californiensis]